MKKQKSIVLTGVIGSGKTTLFNKICKANCLAKFGGDSVTQEVFSKNSAYGSGFQVLDTPGFGSDQRKIAHACAIRCALSEGPLNRILIVAKADRVANMRKYFNEMINQPYNNFRNLITVVVTHWDNQINEGAEEAEKSKQAIILMLKNMNVLSVIFVQKEDSGEYICQQIDQIIANSEAQDVSLSDTEFYSYFDLVENKEEIEQQLLKLKGDINVRFNRVANNVKSFIKSFPKNDILAEVMHSLSVEIKNFASLVIEKFEKENYGIFAALYQQYDDINAAYLVHTELKKQLLLQVNQLREMAQERMKESQKHCFNYIKQCPQCGLIWFKVLGCNGLTSCGNFPDKDESFFSNQTLPYRFKFDFSGPEVVYQDQRGLQSSNQSNKNYSTPTKGKLGCNAQFVWADLPELDSNIQKELQKAGVLDFLADEIESKDQIQQKLNLKQNIKQDVNEEMKKFKVIQL